MAEYERDTERLKGCLDRLRMAMRLTPLAAVSLIGVFFGVLGAMLGIVWMILLALVGAMLGLFVSQIIVAILESVALVLIYLDRNEEGHRLYK